MLKRGLVFLLVLVSIGSTGAAVYLYRENRNLKQNPQVQSQAEVKSLVDKVRRLIVLPDEVPTVATVSDPSKLKDQTFFVNAAKGDKVLIYATAKRAILYDPVSNRIKEVAPVNLGPTADAGAPTTDKKDAGKERLQEETPPAPTE